MFSIDTSKKESQEFSTNKLIIKFNKDNFIEKAIEPKSLKEVSQNISPNINMAFEHAFEVY